MTDMLELKRQAEARKASLLGKINEKENNSKSYVDNRFWSLDYDKSTKVGKAIIRPIGPAMGESDEYVTEYTHFIRRNNKILSTVCPGTAGHKCPICDYYFSKDKDNRDKEYARMTKYIMNILVVNDMQHPENNGKVFLYRCPVSIMQKIEAAIKDKDEMDMPKESINVFDMWEGANVNVISKDKSGWLNYDSSSVAAKSPIFEDVDNTALYEELYKKLYKLEEFKKAPTTEEMKEKFDAFMSNVDTSTSNLANHVASEQKEIINSLDEIDDEIPESFNKAEENKTVTSSDDFWNQF
jgi:hypothetical protein